MLYEIWRIRMLGGLQAQQGSQTISRFRTSKAAELLAYLAYFPHRTHSREHLIELLWPDVDLPAGRNRLKQELASLRRQLEQPEGQGTVFVTSPSSICINPEAIVTDVEEFESLIKNKGHAAPHIPALQQAISLYQYLRQKS